MRQPSIVHVAIGVAGATIGPAEPTRPSEELCDTVVTSLFQAGLRLQVAMDLPADAASDHIAAALAYLDDAIREVRDTAFTSHGHETVPRTPPGDWTA